MPIYLANSGLSQSVKKAYTVVNGVTVPLGSAYRIEDGKTSENMLNTFNGVIYDNGKEYIPMKFTSSITTNKKSTSIHDTYATGTSYQPIIKTKEANDIYLYARASSSAYYTLATVYTNQLLDLSKYTSLKVSYSYMFNDMSGIKIATANTVFEGATSPTKYRTFSHSTSTKWSTATQTLDISSLSSGYIGISVYIMISYNNFVNQIKISKIWLE